MKGVRACMKAQSTRAYSAKANSGREQIHVSKAKTPVEHNRDLILNVLRALPSQREARHYLKRFGPTPPKLASSNDTRPVAGQSVTADVLSRSDSIFAATLQSATTTMHRQKHLALVGLECNLPNTHLSHFAATMVHLVKLGLMPVVLLLPSDNTDNSSGRDVTYGSTRKRHPKIAKDELITEAFRVTDAIEVAHGRAMPLCSGIFTVLDEGDDGLTFNPDEEPEFCILSNMPSPPKSNTKLSDTIVDTGVPITIHQPVAVETTGRLAVDMNSISVSLSLSDIPVIVPLGGPPGVATTLPARPCLEALSLAFAADTSFNAPVKIVLANSRGGIMLNDGHPVGFINLAHEYKEVLDRAAQSDIIDLNTVKSILASLPSSASAVIASAASSASLIENLITDKPLAHASPGKAMSLNATRPPTVLRQGLAVELHHSLNTLDLPSLTRLLDASFGKKLDSHSFYDRIDDIVGTVIVAGDYEGAAVVTHENPGMHDGEYIPYLDKFAVAPSSQGVGVADILWKSLIRQYRDLVWRSRTDNPVNKWYYQRSDGNLRLPGGHWMLFWCGTEGIRRIKSYKSMATDIPATFCP
ncbi:amino-acid N-acetyltransferase [Synchytrium endobioticum]|uniref:Amino-acid acetyltransferase, mitochondrial n=1 Tax=Synchytrium endobioticum TaxID=286115 RepID=A0A507BY89_9FUNG|nr:amino-acid N-acetyltransferase [Synchytrium endobioticum]TPX46687.1 amino-acid N-acetyltransferase [Synchytrium endobioticum]